MKLFSFAVTGHRPNKLWGYNLNDPHYVALQTYFENTVKAKLNEGFDQIEMISGMALGVDTVFAHAAISLKNAGYPIVFTAAIPFNGQEHMWNEYTQNHYRDLLSHADTIQIVCNGEYAAWKMQKRNEFMVDRCDELIAVWDGTKGGTANCVNYAKGKKPITIKAPNTIL